MVSVESLFGTGKFSLFKDLIISQQQMAISSKNNHQYYYLEEINSHSRTTVYLRKGKKY